MQWPLEGGFAVIMAFIIFLYKFNRSLLVNDISELPREGREM